MQQQFRIFSLSLIVIILGFASARGDEAWQRGGKLTCNGPVSNRDTGESLYRRYGEDAGLDTFQDRNGDSFIQAELFSFSDAMLNVKFENNDFVKNVASVEIWPSATAWSVAGLKVGMGLEEVARINGRSFTLTMTGYDLVADGAFSGGRLDMIEGNCRLSVEFMIPDNVKISPSVDPNAVSSDDPALVNAHPAVSKLSLAWPGR